MADLDQMAKDINEIKVTLKGYNGADGLCDKVEAHTQAINRLWLAITVIAVSLGGGLYGIVQAFMG